MALNRSRVTLLGVWLTHAWLACGLCSSAVVAASPQKLVFSVNAPGTKPYLYYDEQIADYQGIVVDFFASIPRDSRFDVEYLDTSRSRYEQTLLEHKADVFISAPEWLRLPQLFLYSNPVAAHHSHLYATSPFYTDGDLKTNGQTTLCTRAQFYYPSLQQDFEAGDAVRLDSSNNSTMTAMLLKNRCQFMVLGKEDAQAELFEARYCRHAFYESPQPISSVNMVLVIRPERADLQATLNSHLQAFVASGQQAQSFRRHSGQQVFPKRPDCED